MIAESELGVWGNRYRSLLSKRLLVWGAAGIGASLIFFVMSISKFLAVSHPLGEGILVVEGWIPSKALVESLQIFHAGDYQYLVVVGGSIEETRSISRHPTTYADLAVGELEQFGFDTKKLIKINVPPASSERTLTGATELKRWLERSGTQVCCVDVLTARFHARKSWIVYQYALGDRYRVGVIAGPEASFDPRHWLVSQRGIWIVVRNLAGYAYYKFRILFGRKVSTNSPSSIFIPSAAGGSLVWNNTPDFSTLMRLAPEPHRSPLLSSQEKMCFQSGRSFWQGQILEAAKRPLSLIKSFRVHAKFGSWDQEMLTYDLDFADSDIR